MLAFSTTGGHASGMRQLLVGTYCVEKAMHLPHNKKWRFVGLLMVFFNVSFKMALFKYYFFHKRF